MHETMVATTVKQTTGLRTGVPAAAKSAAAEDASDGDVDDASDDSEHVGSPGTKRRRPRGKKVKTAKDAGGGDARPKGGKDGKPSKPRGASVTDGKAAVAKARAALIGKSVDDLSKDDCVKAVLCFKCKKPRHGGSDCTARGQTV